jgi:RNA polymerase-binding transcription factor DksA
LPSLVELIARIATTTVPRIRNPTSAIFSFRQLRWLNAQSASNNRQATSGVRAALAEALTGPKERGQMKPSRNVLPPGARLRITARGSRSQSASRSCRGRKWSAEQRALLAIRDTLIDRIRSLEADAREEQPVNSLHPGDGATDSYNRDFLLGMVEFEQVLLQEVDSALERLRDGTYGICERTGKRIPRQRLRSVPWTRCRAEAQAYEDEPHPHVGARGSVRAAEEEAESSNGSSERRSREEEWQFFRLV